MRSFSQENRDEHRINKRIRVPEIRLVGDDGEQLGIMATQQALELAQNRGLDLVEVSPTARPPVCKIMDYGKFKYQEKRKSAEAKKKQTQIELKEVKFRPKIDKHDFDVKVNRLKSFLADGNKGKVTIMFRGREIVHPEIGRDILQRVIVELGDSAAIEVAPKMEGRQMMMIVSPQKQKPKSAAPIQ